MPQGADEPDGEKSGFDADAALEVATVTENANLISDVVAHPQDMPCLRELTFSNPSQRREEITERLEVLESKGVIETVEAATDEQGPADPGEFYRLTDKARDLFDEHGLWPEDPWKRLYERVKKPEEIQELEAVERPDA